ncbi:MAG: DUF1365 domain-containing protein [Burkholderiales bacterium]|nr:DUF1365 domain-containing protein [Burkholderiales bacterium]
MTPGHHATAGDTTRAASVTRAPAADTGWRLVFGQVRHQRLRPALHRFDYPAFFVRVPAHRLDGAPTGTRLFGLNRRGLLSFHESDHGDGQGNSAAWLRGLLAQAGISAEGELWLHTFPRVLGYAFKPVSFWYCHRPDGALSAIVAEVNNTFGERHCYLLTDPAGAPLRQGQTLQADKVFHVSPFCEVKGIYRFRFLDTAARTVARVEHHDEQGPLLITSLSGDLRALSRQNCIRALLGYPLFTLGVIARIHWQAMRLFLRRVPFQPKPAPPARFVTRGSP